MEGVPIQTRQERLVGGEELPVHVEVVPLADALVEACGFGPRSMYVETCWLPVLGPTATWLYRRLGSWAEAQGDDEPVTIDLVDLGVSLGLGEGLGRNSLLAKGLDRLARFDVIRLRDDQLAVRRALAPLSERKARRLSASATELHERIRDSDPRGRILWGEPPTRK